MPLTRLDNLISSKTGKYLYVSPDDFNATDALSNRGNSPVVPFKSIQRAFLEIARYSYLPGFDNDRFDQFTIMLMPGIHYIDNRPGLGTTAGIEEFGFNPSTGEWTDDSILDISNPNNVFYKFNNTEGGAIIPRGSSLVGYDLRRTMVRPLYVPDPADSTEPRSAIFNVTGGCYFWQFTIKDGQTTSESPLYNAEKGTGEVYYSAKDFTKLTAPNYSHHKLTVFEYADKEELGLFYQKIAKAFSEYQPSIDNPGEFGTRVQENRIVGPLSDSRVIESLTFDQIEGSATNVTVTTKINHGYFQGQFVAVSNTEIDDVLEGIFQIKAIDQNDPRKFVYEVPVVPAAIGTGITDGKTVSVDGSPSLGQNAQTLAEVDSVESASPYVFNCSIRSTWGICGIWANGLKATGFKSMVIAQYTGVSLQKDDRAFIRYDEYSNTWNQASLTDAFATVPYHTKGDSYWKDDWRNFHVRASEDAFIQNVSIFAVGFADHFLMESGGDMSITNSNSNFGNTSLHAIGFKGFAFNQDKGGFITDIIPPQQVQQTASNTKRIQYYTIDIPASNDPDNHTKIYFGSEDVNTPEDRAAATIEGYRIGSKQDEKLYVKLDPFVAGGEEVFEATLEPTGFVKYVATADILNPSRADVAFDTRSESESNRSFDAANRIEDNRRFIQEEVFGYILEKYPRLQNISYVNPGLDPAANRYFDAKNLIQANRQEIVDTAYQQMIDTYGESNIQGAGPDGKCKRDIGFIVDAISEDLRDGGNANIIEATKFYFDADGNFLTNGLEDEEEYAIFAFNRARDLCKKAIANLLTVKAEIFDPEAAVVSNSHADAANLITTNKEFIAKEAYERMLTAYPAYTPQAGNSEQDCLDDVYDVIDEILYNLKYGGNDKVYDAALVYVTNVFEGNPVETFIDAERDEAAAVFAEAKNIAIQVMRNEDVTVSAGNPLTQVKDLTITPDTASPACQEVAAALDTLFSIIVQAIGSDAGVGSISNITRTSPSGIIPGVTIGSKGSENALDSSGVTIDSANKQDPAGRNKDARNQIVANRDYILDSALAEIGVYHPDFLIPGDTDDDTSRFSDAYRFIRRNKKEIQDRAVAAIALNHPDFKFPGDSNTAASYRYADAYRLIQQNRDEIQDRALAQIAIDYPDFYFPNDAQTTSNSRFADAYRLIQNNREVIINAAYANMIGVYPNAVFTEYKCKRDIGYYIDAISLSVFAQTNRYARKFVSEYFDANGAPISNGLLGEETESRRAFQEARDLMKQAVTNTLVGAVYTDPTVTADPATGSNTDPNSCANVRSAIDNCAEVVDDVLAAQSLLVLAAETPTQQEAGELKCRRDIGYYVDAVALDLLMGGNEYSYRFAAEYFENATTPISNGLVGEVGESLTAFRKARDLIQQAVSNQLYEKDLTITADNAPGSPYGQGVQTMTPAGVLYSPSTGNCTFTVNSHGLEVGQSIAIANNSITFTCTMDGNNTQHTLPDNRSSLTYGEKYVRITAADQNTFTVNVGASGPNQTFDPTDALYNASTGQLVINIGTHNLPVGAGVVLVDDSFTFTCDQDGNATQHTYPRSTDPASGTSLTIIASDPAAGTITVNVGDAGSASGSAHTFVSAAAGAVQHYPQSVHTFVSADPDCIKFGSNTYNQFTSNLCADVQSSAATLHTIIEDIFLDGNLNDLPLSVNKGEREFNELKCHRDIGYLIDAVALDMFNRGTKWTREFTLQYFDNGVPISNGLVGEVAESVTAFEAAKSFMTAAVTNQLYYKDLGITPDPLTGDNQDPASCANVRSTIEGLVDGVITVLQDGNLSQLPALSERDLRDGETKCRRDIGHVVDAIAQDLWFGGNEYTIAATKEYFDANGLITNGVDNEVGPSVTAFKRAADAMNLAVNNGLYVKDLEITLDRIGEPAFVSDIHADAYNIVLNNAAFIAAEAYEAMIQQFPSYTPSEGNSAQDCKDDIVNVLKEVMWDVKYGGNSKTYEAAQIYQSGKFFPEGLDIFPADPEFGDAFTKNDITWTWNGTYWTVATFLDDTQSEPDQGERDEAAFAFEKAKEIAIKVLRQETITPLQTSIAQVIDTTIVDDWDADENLPKCGTAAAAVDSLMGIIIQSIGNDTDGKGNLDDVLKTKPEQPSAYNVLNDSYADAANLIESNLMFIAKEAYERMLVDFPAYSPNTGNTAKDCMDDVVTVATEILYNLRYGGNDRTWDAANVYVTNVLNGITLPTFVDAERSEAARVFEYARDIAVQVMRNETVTVSSGNTYVQYFDRGITVDPSNPTCADQASAINTLFGIIIQAIGTDAGVGSITSIARTEPTAAVLNNPYQIGNCSDVLSTIDTLTGIVCDALVLGIDSLPPVNNGEWDCANVRATIETLFDIVTEAVDTKSLAGLPLVNTGDFTTNNEASKCFRDVSYIVDAVVSDLRLGGNISTVQAGEAYYVGNELTFIDDEKTETIDAWNYVGSIAVAAMRNFNYLRKDCSTTQDSAIVNVGSTEGIIIGMKVEEYAQGDFTADNQLTSGATLITSNIAADTYVKQIIDDQRIELGVRGSRLVTGNIVTCNQTSSSTYLWFTFDSGTWADVAPTVDYSITQAQEYPECANIASAITTLIGNITTIINSGLGSVTRSEQQVNTNLLAARATVFTVDTTGLGSTNAHQFETGTPVRLVPRPRFDYETGKYVDVDKRLVRLPNGFETNRTYYVIAPGRRTEPERFDSPGDVFDGSDQTKLMLATSKENAAAGIYIYSSETSTIDENVEIDIYQFVLDDKYDLHQYKCKLDIGGSVTNGIRSDVSHIFDLPSTAVTPQRVFIRAREGFELPRIGEQDIDDAFIAYQDGTQQGRINAQSEFFVRYQTNKVFTLHTTFSDAQNNQNSVQFFPGQDDLEFNVYANKRRSPMRFDPAYSTLENTTGKWYLQVKNESDEDSVDPSVYQSSILWRLHDKAYNDDSGKVKTTDTWFTRLEDTRDADERIYRLRYVIPKYLENARDPINGFVIKTRTDDTRKLVPQKILLKPVSGNVYDAYFENPRQSGERIGWTTDEILDANLSTDAAYDPYRKDLTGAGINYELYIRTSSFVKATVQSGRFIQDELDENIKYLELTVYDLGIDTVNASGLRNETFTTVKITAPQGGAFVTNKTQSTVENQVSFTGFSSGLANIHGYFSVGSDHYLIIKNIRGGILEYSEYDNVRFTQGTVFADMVADQDFGKSLPLKTLIRKGYPEYYYKQEGSNVYTMTPGDLVQDNKGNQYYIESVEDVGIIDDTFYIFGVDELQRRIPNQQDGIYYLSAVRANISPFPTGPGNQGNFRNFKFSQPISKLYPLNYKNDPLWFKYAGTSDKEKALAFDQIDPPATFSAADNYIHGLVTVNDFKGSITREAMYDLTQNPAFINNTYTGDRSIEAQEGNATSGSEDRKIPISGDSNVFTDQRYYVELRRPSIARAGNHTFEYLGFGPGNYSTGLPARQEIVLTPTEDFYAQSKKQDAGIVFYTGLNSNGDLYIGNRKINAITGEETFLEAAVLTDSADDSEDIGALVTTFDTPVTFNENITVVGGDGSEFSTFTSPLTVSVNDNDLTKQRYSFIVRSNVASQDQVTLAEQDETLDRTSYIPADLGDIRLDKNKISAAIFEWNPRLNGQNYQIQTHTAGGFPSNVTPNQSADYDASDLANSGTSVNADLQNVNYSGVVPEAGDMLLKGKEVGGSGSLGWILANYFQNVASIGQLIFDNSNVVKITWVDSNQNSLTNRQVGITGSSQIRLSNMYFNEELNLTWQVVSPEGDVFSPDKNYCHFLVGNAIGTDTLNWSDILDGTIEEPPATVDPANPPTVEFSNSSWKEWGLIGGEALRTDTETIGQYRLGVNTVARAPQSSYQMGFVHSAATPAANLDVVGTAFISGRITEDWLDHTEFADRDKTAQRVAFIVGGDHVTPTDYATLRVSTAGGAIPEAGRPANLGYLGVNASDAELDHALTVIGDARFTEDVRFQRDITIYTDGGTDTAEIRTGITTGTFDILPNTTFTGTLRIAPWVEVVELFNTTQQPQLVQLGTTSYDSTVQLGATPNAQPGGELTNSRVWIGGAYNNNESLSYTLVRTKTFNTYGDFFLGTQRGIGDEVRLSASASTVSFFSNSGGPSIINFATNASEVNIAGQGGKTTINNQLEVIASAKFNGDVHICGGVASFSFVGGRGQIGSAIVAHDDGVLSETEFNKNIDIINVERLQLGDEGFQQIDTAGGVGSVWGGADYQTDQGKGLPVLTGDEYYLPLKYSVFDNDDEILYSVGDYLLVDTTVSGARHPEFLQILELTQVGAAGAPPSNGIYIKVKRQPFGTFTAIRTDHPDTTSVYKVNVQFDSTWTEQALDNTGPTDNVYLAEFGGALQTGDYVIIDREDTDNDGIFDQGEVILYQTPLVQNVQKFRISNCGDPDTDVFVVDSTTGEVTIGNPDVPGSQLVVNSSFRVDGGCGSLSDIRFTASATVGQNYVDSVVVTSPDKVFTDIKVGDYLVQKTDGASVKCDIDTRIIYVEEHINQAGNGTVRRLWLDRPLLGGSTGTFTFAAERNELFEVSDGQGNLTFEMNTCSGSATLGNFVMRSELEFAFSTSGDIDEGDPAGVADLIASIDIEDVRTNWIAESYWFDPQWINAGGPSTTLTGAVASGTDVTVGQLNVQGVGEGNGVFKVDDLIWVGAPTTAATGTGEFEIMQITDIQGVDVGSPVFITKRYVEGTTDGTGPGNSYYNWPTGSVVRRVLKHPEWSRIKDIQIRQRPTSGSPVPIGSIILEKGYIVQQKLDYTNWIKLRNPNNPTQSNTSVFSYIEDWNNYWFHVPANMFGKNHANINDEQQQDGAIPYRNGTLTVANDLKFAGGSIEVYDSVNKTRLFSVINDDGHPDHIGLVSWDAAVIGRGPFTLFGVTAPEEVILNPESDVPTFRVDSDGNAQIKQTLTITGATPAVGTLGSPNIENFKVGNLGEDGASEFTIKQDRSINAFGFTNYYTASGGRHTRYISSASDEADLFLTPNVIYMVNTTSATTLIVTLPDGARTGDTVRIVDVGGNLNYNTSLVLRTPETSGTPIQGDSTGTLLGGRITPYPSGELVVQTANAAFTLIYLGGEDSNGQIGIPASVQGWWLMEV